MFDLILPLFPAHSTAATVTTAVWVGVCVVVFFNLRFGWTLSGMVVPGYLVPLLLVKPIVVVIILFEAVVTYLITRQISDRCNHRWFWSSLFGRDRFLVIVLLSILVRAGADGWLLPWFGARLNDAYGLQIDYRNDLHSYGLIVVALIANYFWKPGLRRGLTTSLICLGTSYAFVRFVMLEATNLSVGNLHYMYDDMSTSLLSSPKAYVMVVTTAFVASQMNLRYAWDFNGILIPSLLGLLWHDPTKIAVTIAESAWILLVATTVLKLPIWRRITVEGGRKLLVFFSITAVHRLMLAHLLPLFSEQHITDTYGFGYLLTTLMAIKAHDKKIPIRVWRATVQTSMMGAALGSLLGYSLSCLPTEIIPNANPASNAQQYEGIEYEEASLWTLLSAQRVQLYATKVPGSYQPPLPSELSSFRAGVIKILDYSRTADESLLHSAKASLANCNYRIAVVQGRFIVLQEVSPMRGWGTFVLDCDSESPLLVEIPAPLEEWATIEAGYSVFSELGGGFLAIGGTALTTNSDRSSDVLANRSTIIGEFHRVVGKRSVLQVRGWTETLIRRITGTPPEEAARAISSADSQLFVKRAMPPGLSVRDLNALAAITEVNWRNTPLPNVLRDQTHRGFAELVLSEYDRRIMRSRLFTKSEPAALEVEQLPIEKGHLFSWLAEDRANVARQGSNGYVPAFVEEMLYLDNEVVTPLVRLCRRLTRFDQLTANQNQQLRAIDAAASSLDYKLVLYHDQSTGTDFLVLVEETPKTRNWGTFVFRSGMTTPFVVEVPRPLYEQQTHAFGRTLYQRLKATSLLIAGSHPFANVDGTADVTRMANRVNAYQMVRHVLLREFSTKPMLFIQARAIQSPVDADVVIATDDGSFRPEELTDTVRTVMDALQQDGLKAKLVDGSEDTAGYEVGIHFQAWVLNHSENKRMISLWLSPTVRFRLRVSDAFRLSAAQMEAIGVSTIEDDLAGHLATLGPPAKEPIALDAVEALRRFRDNSDIVHVFNLQRQHPDYRLTRLVDTASDQVFLLIQTEPGTLPTAVNTRCLKNDEVHLRSFSIQAAREFVQSRAFMFDVRSAP